MKRYTFCNDRKKACLNCWEANNAKGNGLTLPNKLIRSAPKNKEPLSNAGKNISTMFNTRIKKLIALGQRINSIFYFHSICWKAQNGKLYPACFPASKAWFLYRSENTVKNKFYGKIRKLVRRLNNICRERINRSNKPLRD